ncbi:MAG: hypothetical protein ACOYD6_08830 [Limnochordia bacterium]|jgi:hypothetical protein
MSFILVLLLLSLATSPAAAGLGGELTLTNSFIKGDTWRWKTQTELTVNYRWRTDDFRFDAKIRGSLPGEDDDLQWEGERLSLSLYGSSWTATLGLQPLTWGVGQTWPELESPLNIYPESFWGVSWRLPTAPLEYWTATVGKVEDGLRTSLRKQGYYHGLRWSALAAWDDGELLLGCDGKIDLGWELYGDFLYHGERQRWQFLVGADYQLGPTVAITEWRHDGLIAANQDFLAQIFTYNLDEFTSLALGVDVCWADGSYRIDTGLETMLLNDLTLTLGAAFPQGKEGSHYGNMAHWVGSTILSAELKAAF